MRRCCLIQRKNNSSFQRARYNWAIVQAGRRKLLVKKVNRESPRHRNSGCVARDRDSAGPFALRSAEWFGRFAILPFLRRDVSCGGQNCIFFLARVTKKAQAWAKRYRRAKST